MTKREASTRTEYFCREAAFGAVSWDFMVDPMFSSYGYWVWTKQFLPLPKLSGIPLTNFVGWFVLVVIMLSVFLLVVPQGKELISRKNTFDSRLVYILLMIDGIVANSTLGNWVVIVIGVASMTSFLAISFYYEKKHSMRASECLTTRANTQTGSP
ncbi:MAG: carotenoid biosynthesis protein [Thaumarchaeota archaeon]|nr:carotenoid biosynthesis protein [Nitrososphaerota archaeon]